MLIVLETKTKTARRISVNKILEDTVYRELQNIFSKKIAQMAMQEIMQTVEFPSTCNCIIRCDNKLYSFDLNCMDVKEISVEMILPTQRTDFGEHSFAVAIEELKKYVMDFTYPRSNSSEVISNPYINVSQYGDIELHSKNNINDNIISSILLDYFSEERKEILMEELKWYLNIENNVVTVNGSKGLYYLIIDENNKLTIERPRHFFSNEGLVNIIKPYLKGYVMILNEVTTRIHNYIFYGVTKKVDGIVKTATSSYIIVELEFEGEKLPAINFSKKKLENYWYIAKPLRVTVDRIFKLIKENRNYCAYLRDDQIKEVQKIMGESKEGCCYQRNYASVDYSKDTSEDYEMRIRNEDKDVVIYHFEFGGKDAWAGFMEKFKKHFDENQEFYVYMMIEK